ncbi:MAG TPA: family 1 glycosylhydrolase [Acidimicrobiales bacterium]|nr:family 1 glycosylhydrolase [Acidimicrobiales bacterium]
MVVATHAGSVPFIGAFESAYQPAFDVDNFESTGHDERWKSDLELLAAAGVRDLRYPVRWHRVERSAGVYDWRATDEVFGWLHDRGMEPIVDLLHHLSHPAWLDGLTDHRFGQAYLRFVEQFARRYPWVPAYTLCNEPFTTAMLAGHEGIWPPHLSGVGGFVELARALLPTMAEASRLCREMLPRARHVYVDACERHAAASPEAEAFTAMVNDRRFFVLDAFLGRAGDTERPFVALVAEAGGEDLLSIEPGDIDVLGLDYYAHTQWEFTDAAGTGHNHSSRPTPLSELLAEYASRYDRPVIVGETNVRGYASDRVSWLKHTLEQCERARHAGVDVQGYCWFPFVDSADWDSVLVRHERNIDPVGVYWLDDTLERRPSCMSEAYAAAASGVPSADLPAYRFRPPVSDWLAGWMPFMAHWDWQDPPVYPTDPPPPDHPVELRIEDALD